jgi:hypothetical protein
MDLTRNHKLTAALAAAVLVAGGGTAYAVTRDGDSAKAATAPGMPTAAFGGTPPAGAPSSGPLGPQRSLLTKLASVLGLSVDELQTKVQTETLAQVAKERGKSVTDVTTAIVGATKNQLDEAVRTGRLTRTQADELLSRIEANVSTIVNRPLSAGPPAGAPSGF